jgi:hypothetical protein
MLCNFLPGKKKSRRGTRGAVRPRRPHLFVEALEGRWLPSMGFLVTNTNDSGAGSLRQAILDADADGSPGPDYINFAISGVQTITPFSDLPAVTRQTVLNGFTQPGNTGTPPIEINGKDDPSGFAGLLIEANGCTVEGFVVDSFKYSGIYVFGAANDVIQSNYVGTDVGGKNPLPNLLGVALVNASNCAVGGIGTGNVLSGNTIGLDLYGSGTTGNVAQYNTIGLSATGTALPNTGDGVDITFGASGNFIGRLDPSQFPVGNTISENGGYGVNITEGSNGNVVEDNYIGTDSFGNTGLGNTQGGVHIGSGSTGNHIGAPPTAASFRLGNIIAGNTGNGVVIDNAGTTGNFVQGNDIGNFGFKAVPNAANGVLIQNGASGNTIGGVSFVSNSFGFTSLAGAGNLISGNSGAGVEIFGATANYVQGNFIGTNQSGTGPMSATGGDGIDLLDGAADNQIGGPTAVDRSFLGNNISGNAGDGVFISSSTPSAPATRNHIEGNFIGVNVSGATALPNQKNGVHLEGGAVANVVGGTTPGTGNTISGNQLAGVEIAGASGAGPDRNNLVEGNFIGTDSMGTNPVGNVTAGIIIQHGASANTIGGPAQGAGNVISANHTEGVELSDTGTTGNSLEGNFIGTDLSGTTSTGANGQPLGNTFDGVVIQNGASGNTVGGTAAGAGNVISGNMFDGVNIFGAQTSANLVRGNLIGTDVSGEHDLHNHIWGVIIQLQATGNVIGGASSVDANGNLSAAGNVISANVIGGVGILQATGNLVEGNFIGTDRTGKAGLANNPSGTGSGGVALLDGASANQIGGASSADAKGDLTGLGNLISGNGFDGILLGAFSGGNPSSGNTIQGNFIGTDVTGMAALPNRGNGIDIEGGGQNNTIGGTEAGLGNVISGNGSSFGSGVIIANFSGTGAISGNLIEGNYIGTDRTGTTATGTDGKPLGNTSDGVVIFGGVNNTVGGAATNAPGAPLSGAGNVISGNGLFGVEITGANGDTRNNWVAGNYIGVDVTGSIKIANQGGVVIRQGAHDNIVGTNGDGVNDPAERNVISGNGGTVSLEASGLVVPDNVDIVDSGTINNVVAGNFIGTDATGTVALPGVNQSGVFIGYGAQSNRIGVKSTDTGAVFERNVISGNEANGVLILRTGTDNNVIAGNYIGTDVTGTRAVLNGVVNNPPNGTYGAVRIGGGSNNTVGGTTTSERNIIVAGNTFGVRIRDDGDNTLPVTGNKVLNNYIGLDMTGTHALGTTMIGVAIQSFGTQPVTGTIIGEPGAGNVISGNAQSGVDLNGAGVTGTMIQANYIGTDSTGMVARPNGTDGVLIEAGAANANNTVGGSSAGLGNVISGNAANGVHLTGANTSTNAVLGNLIGTDVTGHNPLGNGNDGVLIDAGANANTIGGSSSVTFGVGLAGSGNVISGNLNAGVVVLKASNNFVEGNFIGIDLAGKIAVPNDPSGTRGDGVDLLDGTVGNHIGNESSIDANGNLQRFGNVISGNGLAGVAIAAAPAGGIGPALGNFVQGNFIGTDPTGTTAIPNQGDGVHIQGGAQTNTIGGLGTAFRNVISGNENAGVSIDGLGLGNATGNQIEGNFIGTDRTGTTATGTDGKPLGNGGDGVLIKDAAVNNTVGGTAAGAGNVISGNVANGVHITGASTNNNLVEQNFVGTDQTGTVPLGNASDGVLIDAGAYSNYVENGNVISANLNAGVVISLSPPVPVPPPPGNFVLGNLVGTDRSGSKITGTNGLPLGNRADGILIMNSAGNNVGGNTISGNAANGIHLSGAASTLNQVEGNAIGTDIGRSMPLANGNDGVLIDAEANVNTVGGANSGSGNVISGNLNVGIGISQASSNHIEGNFIGTDGGGMHAVKNAADGVLLWNGAANNTIGGSSSALRNVISGNGTNGIRISGTGTTGNSVVGNFIGTDTTGAGPLGNSNNGVRIEAGASGNTIGGASVVDPNSGDLVTPGNVISANLEAGVDISAASANLVQGNFIGTDFTGTTNVGGTTPLGNQTDGVLLEAGAANNIIGGTQSLAASAQSAAGAAAFTGNLLSGDAGDGVHITGTGTSGNHIEGNFIGLKVTGSAALGNHAGVLIDSGASRNYVGGTAAGAVNVISGNNENGVDIDAASANQIQGDWIGLSGLGTSALANANEGIAIYLGSTDNDIGGTSLAARNVISGNHGDGISIFNSGTTGNVVEGNFIGTDVTGMNAGEGNSQVGVYIHAGASGNTIGGFSFGAGGPGARNLISGNGAAGVAISSASTNLVQGNFIGTNAGGTAAVPNGASLGGAVALLDGAAGNQVGGVIIPDTNGLFGFGNLISGNAGDGVFIAALSGGAPVTDNLVQGNYIGTDLTGLKQLANGANGVHLDGGAQDNTIGGASPGLGNTISGNGGSPPPFIGFPSGAGVQIANFLADGAVTGNMVEDNYIGTDSTGSTTTGSDGKSLGNLADGVILQHGVSSNTVGGSVPGSGNVISGNGANGVHLTGAGTSGNFVQGNLIGTDAAGTDARGNQGFGLTIDGNASGNTIGGDSFVDDNGNLAGAGNVIFSNTNTSGGYSVGVFISNATDNSVQGNFIGTDRTGKYALGQNYGVDLREGATGNQIGGASSIDGRGNLTGLGNLISGNLFDGLFIGSASANLFATGNHVEGNFIGTDVTGTTARSNGQNGVHLDGGAMGNFIGGTTAGTRNIISGNGVSGAPAPSGAGVQIASAYFPGGPVENNLVQNNYIGTDVTGLHPLGNLSEGVMIQNGATNNQIGAAGAGNLISGNPEGVIITGSTTTGNVLEANTIGLAADGTTLSTLAQEGVVIQNNAHNNQIGKAGAGNTISGNDVGILLTDANTSNNVVQGDYIGTDPTGELARQNFIGIDIQKGAANNQIGGAGQGNVISSNFLGGVWITGTSSGTNTTGNILEDNLIGTDASGTKPLGNGLAGVVIAGGASGNQIRRADTGNVISANAAGDLRKIETLVVIAILDTVLHLDLTAPTFPNGVGVVITDSGTSTNLVTGNFIGTDRTGTQALGGQLDGVEIANGATDNQIGAAGKPNVISGNTQAGVEITGPGTSVVRVWGNLIGTDVTGTVPLGNGAATKGDAGGVGVSIDEGASEISVGAPVGGGSVIGTFPSDPLGGGNVISGNHLGISIGRNVDNIDVKANYIGTDITGTKALGNTDGVIIYPNNGTDTNIGPGNVISGNAGAGVRFDKGGNGSVVGNLIGTDASGEHMLGNRLGIVALSPPTLPTTVQLGSPGDGNVIAGNQESGISLEGSFMTATVQGNLIGTDAAGTIAFPNGGDGIKMTNVSNATIGGTASGAANVIAGNSLDGIYLTGGGGNVIAGNSIGTDLHDTIPLGNGGDGIYILNSGGNTIGGGAFEASNFIDFNHGNGVVLDGSLSATNTVARNYIGTDVNLTAQQGNLENGIRILDGASSNGIYQNRVAFNGRKGITVGLNTTVFDPAVSNALEYNVIFGNTLGGIDLGEDGVTLNTPNGPHNGEPNFGQNYPVITSAGASPVNQDIGLNGQPINTTGGLTVVYASLNSVANSTFQLQFFASDAPDPTGQGQGQYLQYTGVSELDSKVITNGLFPVTTGVDPNYPNDANIEVIFPVNLLGKYLTATATDQYGNTSEFSFAVPVGPLTPHIDSQSGINPIEGPQGRFIVHGENFLPGATLLLNGTPIDTVHLTPALDVLQGDCPAGLTEEGVPQILTVVGPDGATSNPLTFTVSDAALTIFSVAEPTPGFPPIFEGASFTLPVAGFTDDGGLETPDQYRATIDWGDGSHSDGTVKFANYLINNSPADDIFGTHTYLEEGTYTATVFVRDEGGSYALTTTETITVTDATLSAEPATAAFIEGTPATGKNSNPAGPIMATFTDADPHGYAGLYTATIDWKDGPNGLGPNGQPDITTGTVVADGAGFDVLGTHSYTQAHNGPFTYNPVVTITDAGGASTQVTSTANVSPPPIQASGLTFAVVANMSRNYTVATFSDPDLRTNPLKFNAMITWDDSTAAKPDMTAGTIGDGANGFFTVSASHNFAAFIPANTTHTISITISDAPGGEGRSVTVVDRIVDPPAQDKNGPFVFQLYEDLLGRAPTDAELAHWTGRIHHGTSARQVASDLMRGMEYRTIEVQTAYHAYLQRDASAAELAAATHFLAGGGTVEQLQVRLVTTPEFWQLHGSTATGFLDGLYEDALGHAPDAAQVSAASRVLHPGRLATAVFASTEYRRDLIQTDYTRFLYSLPDKKVEQAFLQAFQRGDHDEHILAAILSSADYLKGL